MLRFLRLIWMLMGLALIAGGLALIFPLAVFLPVLRSVGINAGNGVLIVVAAVVLGIALFVTADSIPLDRTKAMAVRTARRVKRGRCPKCNYDLRGELDKGCSECGWGRG